MCSAAGLPARVRVIDTHTGGEPTRVVLAGGPDLAAGSLAARRDRFRDEFDEFRSAVVNEPRGSDVMVGALVCPPTDPDCVAGVIFFNNVGVIGMCGHGTMGLAVALGHAGRIEPGRHGLETPVGRIRFQLHEDRHHVTLDNVASFRQAKDVAVSVPGRGVVRGDVAWGGNWFFLVQDHGQELRAERVGALTEFSRAIRTALQRDKVTGAEGQEIDHIELLSPSPTPGVDARSFVLCPGGAWDRSPCGTGTSAKLACLAADGLLQPGQKWRQESVVGSVFETEYGLDAGGVVVPRITGSAWVTAEATLCLDPADPFCMGIRI